MREQTRFAVVQEGGKEDTAVPVRGQITDLALRQGSLQPSEHQLPRWELAATDLVAENQRPDQTKNQLQVSIDNVHIANIDQFHAICFDCIECG